MGNAWHREKRVREGGPAAAPDSPPKRPRFAARAAGPRATWGVAEWIGRKRQQEDRSAAARLGDGSTFVGVFDGHSGDPGGNQTSWRLRDVRRTVFGDRGATAGRDVDTSAEVDRTRGADVELGRSPSQAAIARPTRPRRAS